MSIQIQPTGTSSSTRARAASLLALKKRRWHKTLKGQFLLLGSISFLLALILALVISLNFARVADDLSTINSGSIPSVDAAQAMTQYIEDIDAKAADFVGTAGLTNRVPCTVVAANNTTTSIGDLTGHDCDAHNIDAETILANQQLFNATHNVTYPGERTAVERITAGFELYLADINAMRIQFSQAASTTNPTDPHLKQAYQDYLQASDVLHKQISLPTLNANQLPIFQETGQLPTCTIGNLGQNQGQILQPAEWTQGGLETQLSCLSWINKVHLETAYTDTSNFLTVTLVVALVLSLLFCGLLIFSAGRMAMVTHRVINPGLIAAALIGVIFCFNAIGFFNSLGAQSSQASQDGTFKQLVRDDYDSVYYAALLNRYGTNANADESRWLIAQEFGDQANIQHWQNDWNTSIQQIKMLMQNAHANQTWVEELQPLKDMDTSWNQYYGIDSQIRSKATDQSDPNRVLDAEQISTGISNQAFGNFTDAVSRLSTANRDHYNLTLNDAQGALPNYILWSAILFPVIGLFAVAGIWQRLKDF